MSKKHKKVCGFFNYIEHLLILVSTVTGCVFISGFGISVSITSSAVGLKICVITAGVKKYNSEIKKKKKKHEKIVLLVKTKSISVEVLMSKALIDSNISHEEFVSISNVQKEYDDMKEEIQNLKI